MVGDDRLLEVGFICKGKFDRPGVLRYSQKYSKAITTPYVDSVVKAIIEAQGFSTKDLIEPANLYDPDQMYEGLARYRKATKFSPNEEALDYAFRKAFSIFAKPKGSPYLKPLETSAMVRALKMDTSAGIGLIGKKGDPENLSIGLRRERDVKEGRKAPNPCVAFARTQRGGKTRLVWGYPLEMTMMEARFARPIIDQFLRVRTPMTIGTAKYKVGAKISCTMRNRRHAYSLDYSKFDASISKEFILRAFSILETWFSPEDRTAHCWERIIHYFIHTPIVMPDGRLYVGKDRGVPSGSFFTQVIDSVVNLILVYYYLYQRKIRLAIDRLMVLGDDSIFAINEVVELEDIATCLEEVGITLNVSKSRVDSYHYLGAYWYMGIPKLPINEIIKRAICPERSRYIHAKNGEEVFKIAVGVLNNLANSWVEAQVLRPGVNHPSYLLRNNSKLDVDTLFALERARYVEGLGLQKHLPWLRLIG